MSDPALDKLFQEIRANAVDQLNIEAEQAGLRDTQMALNERRDAARRRADLLDRTLQKHVYEQMPVVQAKLVAHDEMDNQEIKRLTIEDIVRSYDPRRSPAR